VSDERTDGRGEAGVDYRIDGRAVAHAAFVQRALDPARSCVVEACAGSGKTWLLVGRVVRLLLAGASPGAILAITFTRRAAQEMRERLLADLSTLAVGSEPQVLGLLGERGLSPGEALRHLPAARALYERVLAAPVPITIETFHGWFARLLRGAPLVSGVPYAPTLLDPVGPELDAAWSAFCAHLLAPGAAAERASYEALVARIGDHNTEALLRAFVRHRADWWAWDQAGPGEGAARSCEPMRARLRALCGRDDAGPEELLRLPGAADGFRALCAAWQAVPGKAQARLREAQAALAEWLAGLDGGRAPRLADLQRILLTDKGGARSDLEPGKVAARAGLDEARAAAYAATWEAALARLGLLRELALERDALLLNEHGLACGMRLLGIFDRAKRDANAIDYPDLEMHAARLLADPAHAAYVQDWLDARYRHLLLDEFQDTNPLQWRALSGWLASYEADAARPSLFVVGDRKQSIYRFRGAEPRVFDAAAEMLVRDYGAARLRTNVTRRNAPEVLAAINRVFGDAMPQFERQSTTAAAAGRVLVLPPVPREAPLAPQAGGALRDALRAPRRRLVRAGHALEGARIARTIAGLVAATLVPEGDASRPARWSDVLVLLPRRTHVAEIERGLREAAIPYRSARRGALLHQLEVEDMLSLLAFLDEPDDDLQLARSLRGPGLGCTEEDLQRLAGGAGWWERLRTHPAPGPRLARARELLGRWLACKGVLPVHDLLDRILAEADLRGAYARTVPASMHTQVQANIDAVLALALELDAGRFPSLPRFLDEALARREAGLDGGPDGEGVDEGMPAHDDVVSVMTIHGAKGLEAPIVVLADTDGDRDREDYYDCLVGWPAQDRAPAHFSLFSSALRSGGSRAAHLAADAGQREQERWNLLYVAMTRCRQVLVVSSVEPHTRQPDSAWSRICRGLGDAAPAPLPGGVVDAGLDPPATAAGPEPAPAVPARRLHDFRPGEFPVGERRAALAPEAEAATSLGKAWHRMLEDAPRMPAAAQVRRIAREFRLDPPTLALALEACRATLADPALARYFDPAHPSWPEIELTDEDGAGLRIDRLVDCPDATWVLDYKWRLLPAQMPGYRAQVRGYLAALARAGVRGEIRGLLVGADGSREIV
jgi:ATP-dependent helicase/nuclease subunit A